jgi:hypothetical protein
LISRFGDLARDLFDGLADAVKRLEAAPQLLDLVSRQANEVAADWISRWQSSGAMRSIVP